MIIRITVQYFEVALLVDPCISIHSFYITFYSFLFSQSICTICKGNSKWGNTHCPMECNQSWET